MPTSNRNENRLPRVGARMLGALVIAALVAVLGVAPASASTTTAWTLLSKLAVSSEVGSGSYSRDYFNHWTDANGDCQNARAEVLIAESTVTPTYGSSRCTVVRGAWFSYYDGITWTNPGDVDIDHMVALKEGWESGARRWTAGDRSRYANDLGFSASLVAVTDNVNQSKGDSDPAAWLPPRTAVRCTYAIQWVQVKYRWRLTIDSAEQAKLSAILSGSCGSRSITVPSRAL